MSFNRPNFLRSIPFSMLLVAGILLNSNLHAQSVADARAQPPGSTVTVRGVVTTGAALGKIRYLQDGTAGIAVYPGTGSAAGFDGNVFPGDSIEVTGTMVSFHDLLEITPITAFSILSTGNPVPQAKPISFAQISDGFESQLVDFECVTFTTGASAFNNSGSYTISNTDGETAKVFLRSGHPMLGTGIPQGPIRITGILSEYDEYQILPSTPADLATETCLYFSEKLTQSDLNTTGFQLNWQTSLPSNCILHLGTNPNPDVQLPVTGFSKDHGFLFTNLSPGTIYWVQIEAENNGETIFSTPVPFATSSSSSGKIKVFFNHSIDPAFANGYSVNGETAAAVIAETIARIDSAQQSIDVGMYNNGRSDLTNALKAAQIRGVQVRYVAALAASNTALSPAPAFPVLYGNSEAIMHNKFMVVDADIANKCWVMSGSLNWTNQNINTDFNNTLFIQDQSLARAYELEFEEMWGSNGTMPDTLNSRFGFTKRDNTPHQFIIGGHVVESYFSPSDQTTSHIETVLRSAQTEALFGAFSFTKNELGDALIADQAQGVPVRGIMENINDNGAEYNALLANGVNVRHHYLSGDFHHKYGIVDPYVLNSDPTVVTGSHNWSVSAETINDENTLILHDPGVAALFKAEFEKRWGEFPTSVYSVQNQSFKIVPNPATDLLELKDLSEGGGLVLVKNTLGQVLLSSKQSLGNSVKLNVSALAPGQYFVTVISAHALTSVPFQKI